MHIILKSVQYIHYSLYPFLIDDGVGVIVSGTLIGIVVMVVIISVLILCIINKGIVTIQTYIFMLCTT